MNAPLQRTLVWALIAAAAFAPLVAGDFLISRLNVILAYAIALLGLNLLVGFSGQISLGHGAFYAAGAYIAAVTINAGADPLLAIVLAGGATFVAGFAFGVPALRLRGVYLALATLALAVVMPAVIKSFDALGGVGGLSINPPRIPFGLPLSPDKYTYEIALVLTVAAALVAYNLTTGRLGRAFAAVRQNENVAVSMGISLAHIKTLTFAVASMFAGIGGAVSALAIGFVAPDSFSFILSLMFLSAIVVGGLRTIGGAVCGAIFLQAVPYYASGLSQETPAIVFGLAMIAIVLFMPRGIWGVLAQRRSASTLHPVQEAP